jgi:hypothetical protein
MSDRRPPKMFRGGDGSFPLRRRLTPHRAGNRGFSICQPGTSRPRPE